MALDMTAVSATKSRRPLAPEGCISPGAPGPDFRTWETTNLSDPDVGFLLSGQT
jgi:hypothetical protein